MATISTVATRTDMAALATGAGNLAYLTEAGREGPFKFQTGNLSSEVTGDNRQGIYVAPASNTTGASGAWVRILEEDVNVRWFGTAADDSTDDYDAFAEAIAFCQTRRMAAIDGSGNPSPHLGGVPILRIPLGTYFINQTLELKGATIQIEAVTGTILRFPANTHGIIVHNWITTGSTATSTPTTGADNAILRGLMIRGGGGTQLKHGIWMRAAAQIYNCNVANFPGDGIHIVAAAVTLDLSIIGNANCWLVEDAMLSNNGRHGLFVQSADSNAGTTKRVNAYSNGRFGIFDASFLGNTHLGAHTQANGTIGAGPVGNANQHSSMVEHNGHLFGVVIGQSAAASTTAPGSNAAVWGHCGPIPEDNAGAFPAWQSGGTYIEGGSYAATSDSGFNVFVGCYEEGDQSRHQIMKPSVIVGGVMAGLGNVVTGLTLRNVNSALAVPALKLERKTGSGAMVTSEIHTNIDAGVVSSFKHETLAPAGYESKFLFGSYLFPLLYNGSTNSSPYCVTLAGTSEKFGTGVNQPHVLAAPRLAIGSRIHSNGTAFPAGDHAVGEIVWNEAPTAGGKVGWVCVTASVPATETTALVPAVWKPFGLIDA